MSCISSICIKENVLGVQSPNGTDVYHPRAAIPALGQYWGAAGGSLQWAPPLLYHSLTVQMPEIFQRNNLGGGGPKTHYDI